LHGNSETDWNIGTQMGSLLNVAASGTKTVKFGTITETFVLFGTFVKKIAKMGISGRLSQNLHDRS